MVTFVALTGCGTGGEVEVMSAVPVGQSLSVQIAACNPKNLQVAVREQEDRVELRATVDSEARGDLCASVEQVRLARPLGDRAVIDASTGRTVPQTDG